MAETRQIPGQALINLYGRWADGRPGMILTGNVMVSPDAMTGPGGVYLDKHTLENPDFHSRFKAWAEAGKRGGSQLYMQISHPGRQVYATLKTDVVSASNTKVAMPGIMEKMFVEARALTEAEILGLIERFADTSEAAQRAGFDGVQIHGAHGYLVSQFLSPLTNLREDKWGGSLENRARFLIEIVRAVRNRVGPDFGVGVKLNSADFQRGGFDVEDAKSVVKWLNAETLDFVELSGGSYESSAMMGEPDQEQMTTTLARELYFIDFARDIAKVAKMPIMVTGGITKRDTAERALEGGDVDIVGIARAYGFHDKLASAWQDGEDLHVPLPDVKSKSRAFRVLSLMAMTKANLYRMGENKTPSRTLNPLFTLIKSQIRQAQQTKRYRRWLSTYF